jgi:hypothetical protein
VPDFAATDLAGRTHEPGLIGSISSLACLASLADRRRKAGSGGHPAGGRSSRRLRSNRLAGSTGMPGHAF